MGADALDVFMDGKPKGSEELAKASVFDNTGGRLTQQQQAAPAAAIKMTPEQEIMKAAIDKLALSGTDSAIVNSLYEKAGLSNLGSQVEKTVTDPVVLLQPYTQPTDYTGQYPQPLDPTEILTQCEEISVWRALPEVVTPFNADQWREMSTLDFATATGLTNDGFFQKGGCPDRITASGSNKTITRMYLGAQQSLSFEDIQHSAAVAAITGLGIQRLLTATVGGPDVISVVRDAKAKEIRKQEILVLNNWDLALVKGNSAVNTLAFDGIETQVTVANGARGNVNTTGAFDIETFDNFLAIGCARPTHLFGHPAALRVVKEGYLSLGATAGAQPIQQVIMTRGADGGVVPGLFLADEVFTAVGKLTLVPDFRFTTTAVGANAFQSSIYALRVYHNGEPIIYKSTQTPLVFKDLVPGCTAISFMVYTVSALVIKHMCAQAVFSSHFTGVASSGCVVVGGVAIGS